MLNIKDLKFNPDLFEMYGRISIHKLIPYIFESFNYKLLKGEINKDIIIPLLKDFLDEMEIDNINNFVWESQKGKYTKIFYTFVSIEKQVFVTIRKDLDPLINYEDFTIYYMEENNITQQFTELTEKYKYVRIVSTNPSFKMIVSNGSNFYTKRFENDNIEFNPYYYNDDFDINKLKDVLSLKKSGLILFSGVPGSGKSSLIKCLSTITNTTFYYITSEIIGLFNSPNATAFLMEELKDGVLILEDCENLLLSRKINKGSGISTILNLTDGIIGNALKLKIIATINTPDKLDEALLRKSRTLFTYDFKLLTAERATKCAEELGIKDVKFTSPTALTDVFNYYTDNGTSIQSNKIGF